MSGGSSTSTVYNRSKRENRTMRFRGLLIAMTALLTLMLLSIESLPPTAATVAAAQSGSGSGDGNEIEGRRIYMRENCYFCHGGFAGGGMCPSLREDPPDESDVEQVIEEGTENSMPPFPHLNEQDIENLAAYFQTLRTQREPTFTHWWEPIPTQ
jgi:mono/diheme cytochrome c family protein